MQRCFFFIFFLAQVSLSAQSVDIRESHLSIWKHGRFAATNSETLSARINLTFEVKESASEIGLLCKGISVQQAQLREGRLKNKLRFEQRRDSLWIYFSDEIIGKNTVEITYSINLEGEENSLYVQQTENVLAFNPMNPSSDEGMGEPGMFFPSLAGDAFRMKLDITVTDQENIGFPGSEEYRVKLSQGVAQFWATKGEITAREFYLIIGTFKEFDAEELEEEFALGEIVLKQMKFEKSKRVVAPYMVLYGLPQTTVSDSEYAIIDSISAEDFASGYFLQREDIAGIDDDRYRKETAIACYLEDGDVSKASERHWSAYSKMKGDKWVGEVMNKKWSSRSSLSTAHFEKVLDYQWAKYTSANSDLMAEVSTTELDTAFLKIMRATRDVPKVKFQYRYVSGDTALYVKYEQDTLDGPVFHFPVKVKMIAGDAEETSIGVVRGVSGELKLQFEKVPNFARVDCGKYFFGEVEDKRPDTYNLYQLSHASTVEERKEALLGLFETSNTNLFSTALGIAMDDENPGIRSIAMDYANDLNAVGQRKLKDTLILLSTEDPSAEVREKAKVLVTKYYEPK